MRGQKDTWAKQQADGPGHNQEEAATPKELRLPSGDGEDALESRANPDTMTEQTLQRPTKAAVTDISPANIRTQETGAQ